MCLFLLCDGPTCLSERNVPLISSYWWGTLCLNHCVVVGLSSSVEPFFYTGGSHWDYMYFTSETCSRWHSVCCTCGWENLYLHDVSISKTWLCVTNRRRCWGRSALPGASLIKMKMTWKDHSGGRKSLLSRWFPYIFLFCFAHNKNHLKVTFCLSKRKQP